jgi:hypothetical protein
MSVIICNNIYPFLKQIGSEFYSCINIYFLEIISSKPIEFFLEYSLQDIVYELLLYIYIYISLWLYILLVFLL